MGGIGVVTGDHWRYGVKFQELVVDLGMDIQMVSYPCIGLTCTQSFKIGLIDSQEIELHHLGLVDALAVVPVLVLEPIAGEFGRGGARAQAKGGLGGLKVADVLHDQARIFLEEHSSLKGEQKLAFCGEHKRSQGVGIAGVGDIAHKPVGRRCHAEHEAVGRAGGQDGHPNYGVALVFFVLLPFMVLFIVGILPVVYCLCSGLGHKGQKGQEKKEFLGVSVHSKPSFEVSAFPDLPDPIVRSDRDRSTGQESGFTC